MSEQTVLDNPPEASANQTLLEACKRLLRAFEMDKDSAPELDIKTCWETNSQAIAAARAAIKKTEEEIVRYKGHRDNSPTKLGQSFWDGAVRALEVP